jgi:hypothetical protein
MHDAAQADPGSIPAILVVACGPGAAASSIWVYLPGSPRSQRLPGIDPGKPAERVSSWGRSRSARQALVAAALTGDDQEASRTIDLDEPTRLTIDLTTGTASTSPER